MGVARTNPVYLSRTIGDMSPAIIRRGLAAERDFSVYEVIRLAEALGTTHEEVIEAARQRMAAGQRVQHDVEQRTHKEIG